MASGLPDLVDCARLAEEAAVLERVYELSSLPRLADVLSDSRGIARASFAFSKTPSGGAGVRVAVRAEPQLVCQRCMQGFGLPVDSGSDVEFEQGPDTSGGADSDREPYRAVGGLVSLKDLAEEELLLALPVAPACSIPESCGRAPRLEAEEKRMDESSGLRRPFSGLKDLLKKT
jgi:uncharacterized protein